VRLVRHHASAQLVAATVIAGGTKGTHKPALTPRADVRATRLTFSISCALTPGSKVKRLLDSQSCIVLVGLFHMPRASLHNKLAEVLAIVQYVPVDLSSHARLRFAV